MSRQEPRDSAAIRQQLIERLAALRSASEATSENRKPVELDQSSVGRLSRMDSLQMQEMALAAERRREAEAARIETALQRIEEGTYGFCILCDEPIAPKRLQADPTVATCIACASKRGPGG